MDAGAIHKAFNSVTVPVVKNIAVGPLIIGTFLLWIASRNRASIYFQLAKGNAASLASGGPVPTGGAPAGGGAVNPSASPPSNDPWYGHPKVNVPKAVDINGNEVPLTPQQQAILGGFQSPIGTK